LRRRRRAQLARGTAVGDDPANPAPAPRSGSLARDGPINPDLTGGEVDTRLRGSYLGPLRLHRDPGLDLHGQHARLQ
jgi:hypothetical protein